MLQAMLGSFDAVFGPYAGAGLLFIVVIGGIFFVEFIIIACTIFATMNFDHPPARRTARR
jgi:hypothetical protein